jgi:hypothetical protein
MAIHLTETAGGGLEVAARPNASAFGTRGHQKLAQFLGELKAQPGGSQIKGIQRIFSEVVVDPAKKILRHAHSTLAQSGPGGAPKGSSVLDLIQAKPGVTEIVRETTDDVIAVVGDAKYGGGTVTSRYGKFAERLLTVGTKVTDKLIRGGGVVLNRVRPIAIGYGVLTVAAGTAHAATKDQPDATDDATWMENTFETATDWISVGANFASLLPGPAGKAAAGAVGSYHVAVYGIEETGGEERIVEAAHGAEDLAREMGASNVDAETVGAVTAGGVAIVEGLNFLGGLSSPAGWAINITRMASD